MRSPLALLLVIVLALAGCTASPSSKSTTTTTSAASGTGAATSTSSPGSGSPSSATGTGGPATTGSHTGTATATQTGTQTGTTHTNKVAPSITFAASPTRGGAPLNVTFIGNATDADGDALHFTLAYGDGAHLNGSALPLNVTHRYTAAGNYSVLFSVSDGLHRTNATATVTVTNGTAGSGALYDKTFTATVAAPNPMGFVSGFFCGAAPPADAVACYENQVMLAYKNGANKTFLVGYKFTVPAGAKTLALQSGIPGPQSCASAPLVGTACVPDADTFVYDPTGAATPIATADAYEKFNTDSPAAGTWTVITEYFVGPPEATLTTHIAIT